MSRIDVVIRGAGVLVVAGVLAGGGAYVIQDGGDPVTANLFLVPQSSSDGSTSCVRSSTLKNYDDALAANAVCDGDWTDTTSWDVACAAATAGDEVGVMPGVYGRVGSGGYLMGGPQEDGNSATPYDCSDGSGADYDPNYEEKGNAAGSLTNWVTFKPGVDCEGDPNISFSYGTGRATFASANWHLIVGSEPGDTSRPGGECFNFNRTLYIIDRGCGPTENASVGCVRPRNIMFRGKSMSERMQLYGLEWIAAKNILLENIDYGPNVQCAANDANATPTYFRCDPSGPYFESPYATNGSNLSGCAPATTIGKCAGFFDASGGANEQVEPYFHGGSFGHYENARLQTFQLHDGQVKGTGGEVHPGCFMFDGNAGAPGIAAHNLVLDGVSCERQVIGIQAADSGVTVQNSYFGVPVNGLDTASPQGEWDEPATAQPMATIGCRGDASYTPNCVTSNVLWRYNVFFPGGSGIVLNSPGQEPMTYSNVRIIANIFVGAGLSGCEASTGCDRNAFWNVSTAGDNPDTLTCDPTVDSDQTNSDTWSETTLLDPRLSGSSCGLDSLDLTALGADYDLDHTIDGTARSTTSTKPGVDE